jgi:hypothetical protein
MRHFEYWFSDRKFSRTNTGSRGSEKAWWGECRSADARTHAIGRPPGSEKHDRPGRDADARQGSKLPGMDGSAAIVAMKRRNPKFGCARIAEQISHAFGLDIDKDVERRADYLNASALHRQH